MESVLVGECASRVEGDRSPINAMPAHVCNGMAALHVANGPLVGPPLPLDYGGKFCMTSLLISVVTIESGKTNTQELSPNDLHVCVVIRGTKVDVQDCWYVNVAVEGCLGIS